MSATPQVAGLDFPGDATNPCVEMAKWLAAMRGATEAGLDDFLTAIYILHGGAVSKYWPTELRCKHYLERVDLRRSRASLLDEFWRWSRKMGGKRHRIPGSGWSVTIRVGRLRPSKPKVAELVKTLLDEVHAYAATNGMQEPRIEAVLLVLAENSLYREKSRLISTGIDIGELSTHGFRPWTSG